jgi:hypothetical protein
MKTRPVGAQLFHAEGWTDGQTDMTKLIVAFRNFANAPTSYARSTDIIYGAKLKSYLNFKIGVTSGNQNIVEDYCVVLNI